MSDQVCPWCQMEIFWEEEDSKSECPHCQNELGEYRVLDIPLEELDEDVDRIENLSTIKGETILDKLLSDQEELPECPHCRHYMIKTDEQAQDRAITIKDGEHLLLDSPYTLDQYLCPSCFHVSRRLNLKDQLRFAENLMNLK